MPILRAVSYGAIYRGNSFRMSFSFFSEWCAMNVLILHSRNNCQARNSRRSISALSFAGGVVLCLLRDGSRTWIVESWPYYRLPSVSQFWSLDAGHPARQE